MLRAERIRIVDLDFCIKIQDVEHKKSNIP